MLRQTNDRVADALYLQVSSQAIDRTIQVGGNVYLDLDADGFPVGIEVVGLSRGCLNAPQSVASILKHGRAFEQARYDGR